MAKVTFITLYDQLSRGIRVMSKVLREAGHDSDIIYFKISSFAHVKLKEYSPDQNPFRMDSMYNGELCIRNIDIHTLWTSTEVNLLIGQIKKSDPDIIGFSCRSFFDQYSLPLLKRIKQAFPVKVVVAGGFGPVLDPELYLSQVDFVAFGDGEDTILAMANTFDTKQDMKAISNLIYFVEGKVVRNPVRPLSRSLDEYPFPDFDDIFCYIENDECSSSYPYEDNESRNYLILAGRGCPESCSYCSAHQWRKLYKNYGHTIPSYRRRSVENILKELRIAKEQGYVDIAFIDSYLTGPKSFLLELFHRYKVEIGLPFSAFFSTMQLIIFPEILDAACDAGLKKVIVGVQHGSQGFRHKYFNRNLISNEQILDVAQMFHERKVVVEFHLISGIPFETDESLDESFLFVSKLPMQYSNININRLVVLPHSPLERLMEEKNLPKYDYPSRWYLIGILYYIRTMVDDDLFNSIRLATSTFLKNRSDNFQDLVSDFYKAITNQFQKNKVTTFGNSQLLEIFYSVYVSELKRKPVLIWGTGRYYTFMKSVFKDLQIEAFVDNDTSKHGKILDDIPIVPPDYLKNVNLPVFICSDYKRDIVRQITENYPHISFIP